MQTYNNFFGSCRIPCEKEDSFIVSSGQHFVIAYKNQFFSVHLNDNERKCESTLVQVIAQVVACVEEKDEEKATSPPVGVYTSENRRTWWALRDRLIQLGE